MQFNHGAFGCKSMFLRGGEKGVVGLRVGDLLNVLASAANQEEASVRLSGRKTGDEGVKTVDLVHQALRHQKIQSAIDGWRRGRIGAEAAKFGQQLVCAHRLMALTNQG